jgi:hypothetical protein
MHQTYLREQYIMKTGTILATVSAIALAAGAYHYFVGDERLPGPPEMQPDGEAIDDGVIVKRRTVDYEAVIKSVLTRKARFLTTTLSQEKVRDQELETKIWPTPITSRARVRVKYRVEFPIGYDLGPGDFAVSGNAERIVLTLARPQLIARPSVRLLSARALDTGFLVDENSALLKLQQRIQPEEEGRAAEIVGRPGVIPRSERALLGFLQPVLQRQANGGTPPSIEFRYR